MIGNHTKRSIIETILKHGSSTIGQIIKYTGLPQTSTYRHVNELVSNGILTSETIVGINSEYLVYNCDFITIEVKINKNGTVIDVD